MTETQTHLVRLEAMAQQAGFWLVDTDRVNLTDFCRAFEHEGAIVRVIGGVSDAIKFVTDGGTPVDCIAGWASEDA